ncbi:DUF6000 family protein [Amycolatopsis circi]|uniref:DUF6000 family protein n=1 Tax=Amycolatopsis circi TaxID=871959 RepID=UPI000E259FAB|nr:DUF6000 family protein [Amycolatopsis circi]
MAFRDRCGHSLTARGKADFGTRSSPDLRGYGASGQARSGSYGKRATAADLIGLVGPDLHYDQHWAMGALLYLDARLGTDRTSRFVGPGEAWHRWTAATATPFTDPGTRHHQIDALCSFADRCMRSGSEPDTRG